MTDISKKNFRNDRNCESCMSEGAALVSLKVEDFPRYLCKTCMKFGLNHGMTVEEIITMVEKHWGIEADAKVDKCKRCGSDRIYVESIDGERYFTKCGCMTEEGFKQARVFRI